MKLIFQILCFFISICFFGQNKEENKNIDSQNSKNQIHNIDKIVFENLGKPIAIVLNKKLISATIIQSVIPNGKIQISGKISNEELKGLKKSLKK